MVSFTVSFKYEQLIIQPSTSILIIPVTGLFNIFKHIINYVLFICLAALIILDVSNLRVSISEGDNASLCQKEKSEKTQSTANNIN